MERKMKNKVNEVKKGILNPTLDYCRSNHTPEESVLLWNAYIDTHCKSFIGPAECYEYKYNRGVVTTHKTKTWEEFDFIDGKIAEENEVSKPQRIDGVLFTSNDNGDITDVELFYN
jgi:hypothetical protein